MTRAGLAVASALSLITTCAGCGADAPGVPASDVASPGDRWATAAEARGQLAPATPPAPVVDATAAFYDPEVVQDITLEISESERARMLDALPERVYATAAFRWGDVSVHHVGVRFKGDSSSSPGSPWKRSFLVKFDYWVPGQRFLGLRRVALDNGIQFGSVFSERLLSEILAAEGVAVSRSNHARLWLGESFEGVFVNVERIDEVFIERRFGGSEGRLYKNHHGGPGADLGVLASASEYEGTFEAKLGDDSDFEDLLALATLVAETPAATWAEEVGARVDLDSLLRFAAVAMLGGAFDQYTGWNAHNYYLYDDPLTGRWTYLPWDLDVGFADDAFGKIPVIANWDASWPLPVRPRPLLERALEDPALRQAYRGYAADYLERYFEPAALGERLDALHADIADDLEADPYPHRRATNPEDTDWASVVASLKAFMVERYAAAAAELAAPRAEAPTYTPEPPDGGGEGPQPGPPSADAPSDLTVVSATAAGGVVLEWTDNADGEFASVLQRCQGAGCEGFANHIGEPVEDLTTLTDPAVQAGVVYRYRVYAVHATPAGPVGTGVSNVVEAIPD